VLEELFVQKCPEGKATFTWGFITCKDIYPFFFYNNRWKIGKKEKNTPK
jgi:hypothetical protein